MWLFLYIIAASVGLGLLAAGLAAFQEAPTKRRRKIVLGTAAISVLLVVATLSAGIAEWLAWAALLAIGMLSAFLGLTVLVGSFAFAALLTRNRGNSWKTISSIVALVLAIVPMMFFYVDFPEQLIHELGISEAEFWRHTHSRAGSHKVPLMTLTGLLIGSSTWPVLALWMSVIYKRRRPKDLP
ncbi:hypothetical protein ACCM60_18905 [Pseudomonas chlororaphis subsp. aureofaciens]|uniref:hypothetical protein n=1 Tax=Pseudomonas chlororaphis TaxID=587753 RepID=UPI0035587FB6